MKKLKMILPMLAFVLAIGVSYAFVNTTVQPEIGYVFVDNEWKEVNVNCGMGELNCKVKFLPGGEVYQVFDANLTTPRTGNSEHPILITP